MLTGRETIVSMASATAHRMRGRLAVAEVLAGGATRQTTWDELLVRVRHVTLGLAGESPDAGTVLPLTGRTTAADRVTTFLAGAAAGLVPEVPRVGAGGRGHADLDLEALAAAGAAIDHELPDRFEALVASRSADEPVLSTGTVTHTHASLIVAARSLAQAGGLAADDRLLVCLPWPVAQLVAGLVVPCLSGAAAWTLADGASVAAAAPVADPTLALLAEAGAQELMAATPVPRRRVRRGRGARPVVGSRVVQVGDGSEQLVPDVAGPTVGALSIEEAGGLVAAFGPPGSFGRPLPGVSLGIDDDGQLLVRTGATAPGAPGLRPDGWLPTGRHGRLEEGALFLEGPPVATVGQL